MRSHLILVILFSLAMSACVPFPHSVTLVPQIEGKINASSVPIEGAKLYLSTTPKTPCSEESQPIAVTDQQGKFHIEPIKELRWIYVPMVAPISVSFYTLCVAHARSPSIAYREDVAPYRENPPVVLSCDLERPRQLTSPDMSKLEVVCERLRAK